MLLIKALLLFLLVLPALASPPYSVEVKGGYGRVLNHTNNALYCYMGQAAFYVNPAEASRWYPYSQHWDCNIL